MDRFTNHFGEQLSVATLGKQLSGVALQSSFGEPFWGIGLKSRSFGATALDSNFGEHYGEQLWGAALSGDNFPEQLWGMLTLKNSSFRAHIFKELRGATFSGNFEEQLWGSAFRSTFGSSFGPLEL